MAVCSCGKTVDELYSYFDKVSKYRITCCEQCAIDNKLDDADQYEKHLYKNLNQEQNKTPEPDASRD
jgi:PHP family Zn ribbon phosphoesterase